MKGIRQAITKDSFKKSTLAGVIRKGFVSGADIDSTKLTDKTKQAIAGLSGADLFFVRDKWLCFAMDTKNKVLFCPSDCGLADYAKYFIDKNPDYKVQDIGQVHPADIHARGLAVDKVAQSKGFVL